MRDIDLNLTEEQRFLRDTVRKFGAEVVRPAGLKLDKMADPQDTIAKDSVLWDVIRQWRELGLHLGELPRPWVGLWKTWTPCRKLSWRRRWVMPTGA